MPASEGDHTRKISKSTPSIGGIMSFTKKTDTCLGCRTPLKPGCELASSCRRGVYRQPYAVLADTAVCQYCKEKEGAIYQEQVAIFFGSESALRRC